MTHRPRSLRHRLQHWLPSPDALRGHPRLGRWLKPFADPRLWTLQRRRVALGAAIGATFSVIPLPVQLPLAIVGAILLRANLPAAAAGTLLSNPITFVAILTAAWEIGTRLLDNARLGTPLDAHRFEFDHLLSVQGWIDAFDGIAEPMLVGLPIVGLALGVIVYVLVMAGWRGAVVHHWRTRHPKAAAR